MAQVRVRKRGKTFSYIFEAGKIDGHRKVVEKGGFATRDAAYKAGVAAYNDFVHGNIGITSNAVALKDFMTNWLANVVADSVKPSSLQAYRSILKNHIEPTLGAVKVQDLTPAMLDKWIRDLQRRGLSHNTISAIHALISNATKYAVYPAQLISSNPAAYIKVPRSAPRNIIKRHIITPKQFAALLEKYPFGSPYYIPLLLLYHTGMRIGEVLGLLWQDVDFANKQIIVRRQLCYLSKRGYFLTSPKTETSKRYIVVDDFLLGELRRWQAQQAVNEQQSGDTYVRTFRESDGHILRQSKNFSAPEAERALFVCTQNNGQLVLPNYITIKMRGEGLNAHSFRHTHATQLIENGASLKGVAGRLGHANTQITQNLYTHNTRKLQVETAAIFAENLQTNL